MATYRIVNTRTGEVLAGSAWLANRPWSRMVGLLGRSTLEPGKAIILRPSASIHTAFMRFALDVLFLDRAGKILKVERNLKPFRLSSAHGAKDTIEMAAGCLPPDIEPGDALVIEPAD